MSVSGHRNESSVKTYSKTDANTKTNQARSLMAVIDNSKTMSLLLKQAKMMEMWNLDC